MTALTISTAVGNAAESARVAVALPPGPATRGPAADTLEIVVSLQDIRDGLQCDVQRCAVAVALRRTGHKWILVFPNAGVSADGVLYDIPTELQNWLNIFDRTRSRAHPDRWVLSPRETPVQS